MIKKRFGALLCIVVGAILVTGGMTGTTSALGGEQVPTCQPVTDVGIVVANSCPEGRITVMEQTSQASGPAGPPPAIPAAGWSVHITSSNCTDTSGAPVDMTLAVPDGAGIESDWLFLFADPAHQTPCAYSLTEDPVDGFTASFDPASPVSIPYDPQAEAQGLSVNLANTYVIADPTSAPPTSSSPATTPASSPVSTSASSTPSLGISDVATSSAAASPVAIPDTGPRTNVGVTLWLGIALLALGGVLLVAGRRQRVGTHRSR